MYDVPPLKNKIIGGGMHVRNHCACFRIEALDRYVDLEPGLPADPELGDALLEEPLDVRCSGYARSDDNVR